MQVQRHYKIVNFFATVWQYFSFSDVTKVMKELRNRQAEKQDLDSIDYINKTLKKKEDYPPFLEAISDLRKSPFRAIIKFEKKNLFSMFFMHMTDVIITLCAAILSIQILRTFESKTINFQLISLFYNNPTVNQKLYFVIILALFIFILNLFAASLHAQKIEKEMYLSWNIPTKIVLYGYKLLLNISRKSRSEFQSGDLINVVQNDTRYIADFFSHAFVDFPVLLVSTFIVVFIMQIIIGKMAWLGFAMVCLQLPISLFLSWIGNILHRELMRRSDKRIQLISEWIQGMRLIRYFGWGKHFQQEINLAAKSEFIQGFKITTKYSFGYAITTNWWMVVSSAIFAGVLYFHGQKEASTIFAAIWLSTILGTQITPLPWFVNIFSQSVVGSARLRKFFLCKTQQEEFNHVNDLSLSEKELNFIHEIINKNKSGENVLPAQFSVSFSLMDVSLRFSEDEPWVLNNISLEIEANKTIAIIGPVGSGKSLLIQILMGEIIPNEGKVYINIETILAEKKHIIKININSDLGLQLLRSVQSYVPQEAFIFSATIAENVPITYNPNFNAKERNLIMNALYAASMGRDIEHFESKIDTEIGEKGVNLSGGQRQRINLSRSAFTSSSAIFLDDPLSALDFKTEEDLVNNIFLNAWGKNKTIVWSTHRLGYVSYADKIILIEEGYIVEEGSYEQLINNHDSRLYKLIVGDV